MRSALGTVSKGNVLRGLRLGLHQNVCFTRSALGTVSKRDVLLQTLPRYINAMFYHNNYSYITQITMYVTFGRALGVQNHRIDMFYEVCAWDRIKTQCFTRSALGTVSKCNVLRGLRSGPYQNAMFYFRNRSEATQIRCFTSTNPQTSLKLYS